MRLGLPHGTLVAEWSSESLLVLHSPMRIDVYQASRSLSLRARRKFITRLGGQRRTGVVSFHGHAAERRRQSCRGWITQVSVSREQTVSSQAERYHHRQIQLTISL